MEKIGIYSIEKLIAKGGMGEVYLVKDPICERKIALKRIRMDLIQYEIMQKRFLSEAKIAAKLSHPSIIPIYFIHQDSNEIYYTMPFIEGSTLRDILKESGERIKKRETPHPIGSSIPSLIRIFLNVCQAISFAHSKGFLHRDLKPGNIMVGSFGQVLILDWGLAKPLLEKEEEEAVPLQEEQEDLTRPGKAVGTLTYMAPERAFNRPASIKTEIYALGVILYQLLTLKSPFRRSTLKEFKANVKQEKLADPISLTPDRDIPLQLSEIAKKCLSFHEKERFNSVAEVIQALENYIEGKPDWIFEAELSIGNKECWQIQENIMLAKQMAFLKTSETARWVALMVSKAGFTGNFKIEAHLIMHRPSDGVGFLFCIPEMNKGQALDEGFWFWLGTKKNPGARLYRNNVEILRLPEVYLKTTKTSHLIIEKVENHLAVLLNGEPILNYTTYMPIVGSHVGLICKDMNFEINNWNVYVGSGSAMVNCLSIPDAFLASKDFKKAFDEYQKIHKSFKGRLEGREALFRSGITLIEEGKTIQNKMEREPLLEIANEQFEALRATSGAPLEYLGKSMIYQLEKETEDELKCLEIALCKYPHHPLLHMIEEQVIFRMHESAKENRKSAFRFALLALRYLKHSLSSKESLLLLENLNKNIEPLGLFIKLKRFNSEEEKFLYLTLQIAHWLDRPRLILEILEKDLSSLKDNPDFLANILLSLLYLDHENLKLAIEKLPPTPITALFTLALLPTFEEAIEEFKKIAPPVIDIIEVKWLNFLFFHFKYPSCPPFIKKLRPSGKAQRLFDLLILKISLIEKDFARARLLLDRYPTDIIHPLSPFYGLHLIYQMGTGGKERVMESLKPLIHLRNPPITALLAHFLTGKINLLEGWILESFKVEKDFLFEQLFIFYSVTDRKQKLRELQKSALHISTA